MVDEGHNNLLSTIHPLSDCGAIGEECGEYEVLPSNDDDHNHSRNDDHGDDQSSGASARTPGATDPALQSAGPVDQREVVEDDLCATAATTVPDTTAAAAAQVDRERER